MNVFQKGRIRQGSRYRVGAALVFGAMVLLWPFSVFAAEQTGGIGGRPARPDLANPRTQSIFIHQIEQGKSVEDAVLVSNGSTTERTIDLYTVDGVVTNTGAYTCRQKAEPIEGSGGWIKLETDRLTLGPGESQTVPFTITVPDQGVSVGEHDACLVFADAQDEGTVTGGVRIQTRQAIRVATIIPGELHTDVALSHFAVTDSTFELGVKNQGNVSSDVEVAIDAAPLIGKTQQPNKGQYPVLPDQKIDLVFDRKIDSFWGGWYSVTATVRYNEVGNGSLGFDASKPTVTRTSETIRTFVRPSPVALIIYAVAGMMILAGLAWLIGRKMRRSSAMAHTVEYKVKQGDTIESVAKNHACSWAKIAKLNQLKAPYTLKADQVLRVPKKRIRHKQK